MRIRNIGSGLAVGMAALAVVAFGEEFVPEPPAPIDPVPGTVADESTATGVLWWLKAHQKPDGSWDDGPCPSATTALAVLAFLGSGEYPGSRSPREEDFRNTFAAACAYLRKCISETDGMTRVSGEELDERAPAIVAMSICRAYAITRNPNMEDAAALCLRRLIYDVRDGTADGPLNGGVERLKWTALALDAGNCALMGMDVKVDGLGKSLAKVQKLTDGIEDDGFFDGARKYRAWMKKTSTAGDREAFMAWLDGKREAFAKTVKEEPGVVEGRNGVLHRKCFLPEGIDARPSRLGKAADSALGVTELWIGGNGGRNLPSESHE